MEKYLKVLKSRTVWSIVALFVISGVEGIREFINPSLLSVLNVLLPAMAVYFRINPKQELKE